MNPQPAAPNYAPFDKPAPFSKTTLTLRRLSIITGIGFWVVSAVYYFEPSTIPEGLEGPIIAGLFVAPAFFAIPLAILKSYRKKERSRRMQEFGALNNIEYVQKSQGVTYNASIFRGDNFYDILRSTENGETLFELGSHKYVVRRRKSSDTYYWTYFYLDLNRNLPHMRLDAKSNNKNIYNISKKYGEESVVHLEGNFDEHFTLYAPPEYQMDARYVFTPDVMALLIDESSMFDAEIIDDKIFFYTYGEIKIEDIKTFIQRALRIRAALGPKLLKQTNYYSDQRVGDRALDTVAKEGRRLKMKMGPLGTAISFIVFGLYLYYIIWGLFFY